MNSSRNIKTNSIRITSGKDFIPLNYSPSDSAIIISAISPLSRDFLAYPNTDRL